MGPGNGRRTQRMHHESRAKPPRETEKGTVLGAPEEGSPSHVSPDGSANGKREPPGTWASATFCGTEGSLKERFRFCTIRSFV